MEEEIQRISQRTGLRPERVREVLRAFFEEHMDLEGGMNWRSALASAIVLGSVSQTSAERENVGLRGRSQQVQGFAPPASTGNWGGTRSDKLWGCSFLE